MSNERQYFCLCLDNCLFETMTKEQIIAAIAEATGATPTQIDDAFITKIKELNKNTPLKFWIGTQAEYNAIATKDANTLYMFTDRNELSDIQTLATNAAETKATQICAPLEEDVEDLQDDVEAIQTELDKKGVVLYSGNIAYGDNLSVNVDNLSDYTVVDVQAGAEHALCYINRYENTFKILGAGTGAVSSANGIMLSNICISGNGNTITQNTSTVVVIYGTSGSNPVGQPTERSILKIIGIR